MKGLVFNVFEGVINSKFTGIEFPFDPSSLNSISCKQNSLFTTQLFYNLNLTTNTVNCLHLKVGFSLILISGKLDSHIARNILFTVVLNMRSKVGFWVLCFLLNTASLGYQLQNGNFQASLELFREKHFRTGRDKVYELNEIWLEFIREFVYTLYSENLYYILW